MKVHPALWRISPNWAKKLHDHGRMGAVRKTGSMRHYSGGHFYYGKEWRAPDGKRHDLCNPRSCLVGEAWLMSREYCGGDEHCSKCQSFSYDFFQKRSGITMARQKAFVKHFLKKHSDKLRSFDRLPAAAQEQIRMQEEIERPRPQDGVLHVEYPKALPEVPA